MPWPEKQRIAIFLDEKRRHGEGAARALMHKHGYGGKKGSVHKAVDAADHKDKRKRRR